MRMQESLTIKKAQCTLTSALTFHRRGGNKAMKAKQCNCWFLLHYYRQRFNDLFNHPLNNTIDMLEK